MPGRNRVFTVLAVSATLISSGWAVEESRRSEAPAPAAEVRQREGGGVAVAEELRRGGKEGTEEGMPEARGQALDRRERMLVEPRWRLGVFASNTDTGVVITRVIPGSAAWRVGFEPGDRIVAVGGYQVGVVDQRVFYLGEELQQRADPRGRVLILAQNVRDDRLLNIDVQLDGQRRREPPFPGPRVPMEGAKRDR
ncbi:MAG: PDZ domain-containing protein [Thermoguttaceae bacterium]